MKILVVSRGGLEIGRVHLNRPNLVLGRSPTCDLVLRAPGVKAIHFLMEWVGDGNFDTHRGEWSVVDISQTADAGGEGIVLGPSTSALGGFYFMIVEDKLESADVIGGRIQDDMERLNVRGGDLLEVVQIRRDSGAVEDIVHLRARRQRRVRRVFKKAKEFKIEFHKKTNAIRVLLEEMPGAVLLRQGTPISEQEAAHLGERDLLQVQWKDFDFYLRLVKRLDPPKVAKDPLREPLLKKTLLVVFGAVALLIALSQFIKKRVEDEPKPQLRVATIQIKEVAPPPPPPVPVKPPLKPKEEVADKVASVVKKPKLAGLKENKAIKKPGRAAAPRFNTQDAPPKLGLNSPAEVQDVNTVGLLGALKKSGPKGGGVRADQIFNEGIVTQAVSGANDSSGIVLKNPLAGALGRGGGGTQSGKGVGLGSAATTLQGAGKYDATSVGPIARKGGGSGYNLGSGLGDGKGVGSGSEMGTIDSGEFSVEGGGLDRETVRRVIASYRGRVRTCYERALLSSPRLNGRVTYKWAISPDGPVLQSEIVRSSVESSHLKACVLQVIREMKFPRAANGLPTRVIYPFVFQAKQ